MSSTNNIHCIPVIHQMAHRNHYDKIEVQPATVQFDFSFFASELPLDHD